MNTGDLEVFNTYLIFMYDTWEKMLNGKYDSGTTITDQLMNVLTTYVEDNLLYKYTQC